MAASDLLAGTVMQISASLLNDTARTVYTYAAQIPYLQMALQELREHFELHKIPCTEDVSAIINMPAGSTQITYNAVGSPSLPNNFVDPTKVWESAEGQNSFSIVTRCNSLPPYTDPISNFGIYVWQNQILKFLPSLRDNDIKLDYVIELFQNVVDENSPINIVNAQSFLEYRTASLCAEFIERNLASATGLNQYAILGIDRATGISAKSKQTIVSRRKPFRQSYKRRN